MSDYLWPHRLYCPWNSPGQNTGVGSLSFLQEIFSTQRSNPDFLHWRWILYQQSHKGSSRILEWVAYPFSSGSFQPRIQTHVACIAGRFFTNWAIREALVLLETLKFPLTSSVQFSRSPMSNSLRPHESQQARPSCPSPTPRVYANSCPSSRWYYPAISSSVVPFSSCPQSFPATGSFPMSQLFARGGQGTGVSASASVLPMNTQD